MPRAGFCAIVGLPNVGKSTLLNRILGQRLAAVSPKPQTTRTRLLGVHHAEGVQVAFVDTPGIQQGAGALRKFMRDESLSAAGEAEVAVLVVDASDPRGRGPDRFTEPDAAPLAEAVRSRGHVIALNKVDRVAKPELLPLIERWHAWSGAEVVPIAALSGDGVDRLLDAIARKLPEGPALFPDDMLTDRPDRFLAGELIREQLYHQLGKELPYAAAVIVEQFEEDRGEIKIGAVIAVERESQKGIVVGKRGARIKELGIAARHALSQLFECPVHLALHVKVVPDWSRVERGLRQVGYQRERQS
jgi:GTP-binding protein Era